MKSAFQFLGAILLGISFSSLLWIIMGLFMGGTAVSGKIFENLILFIPFILSLALGLFCMKMSKRYK